VWGRLVWDYCSRHLFPPFLESKTLRISDAGCSRPAPVATKLKDESKETLNPLFLPLRNSTHLRDSTQVPFTSCNTSHKPHSLSPARPRYLVRQTLKSNLPPSSSPTVAIGVQPPRAKHLQVNSILPTPVPPQISNHYSCSYTTHFIRLKTSITLGI
jgi:hypothetical protein